MAFGNKEGDRDGLGACAGPYIDKEAHAQPAVVPLIPLSFEDSIAATAEIAADCGQTVTAEGCKR